MRRHLNLRNLLLTSGLLLAGFLAGCSADSTVPSTNVTGSDDYAQIDFSLPYGGLTTSDEMEAFGDASLLMMSQASEGEDVVDPVAGDPDVINMENQARTTPTGNHPRPRITFVHLRWGLLQSLMDSVPVDSSCSLTDWSGSVTLDRGVLRVRRVFRFERPGDQIVFPRPDRQTVGIASTTACGVDGVLLQILERPSDYANPDSTILLPNVLHINLGAYSVGFMVQELAGMQSVVDVDAMGNKFGVVGFTPRDLSDCPRGFLRGFYRHLPASVPDSSAVGDRGQQLGIYAGVWRALGGALGGHLRGGYGIDASGQRIFIGKYVGPHGRFRGLIRGTWEAAAATEDFGRFQGQWVSRNGQLEGLLAGQSFAIAGRPGGVLRGRWETLCAPAGNNP